MQKIKQKKKFKAYDHLLSSHTLNFGKKVQFIDETLNSISRIFGLILSLEK